MLQNFVFESERSETVFLVIAERFQDALISVVRWFAMKALERSVRNGLYPSLQRVYSGYRAGIEKGYGGWRWHFIGLEKRSQLRTFF